MNFEANKISLFPSKPALISGFSYSEGEKQRRWQEIRKRQHRLISEADRSTPAHIEQIMKSGFSMTDIKGREYDFLFLIRLKYLSPSHYTYVSIIL